MKLQETYDMVLRFAICQTEEQVSQIALKEASRFGVDYYFAGTIPPEDSTPTQQLEHVIGGSWPSGWGERYFKHNYLRTDPTIEHVRSNNSPLIWKNLEKSPRFRNVVMDEARDFGLNHGITIPQFSLDGVKIGISFAGQNMDIADPKLQTSLTVIGAYTVSSILRVLQRNYRSEIINLTEREREVLYWISEGKTSRDISAILSIAKPTVEKHFTTLQHKLCAQNRTHAVAEAMRRGLLR